MDFKILPLLIVSLCAFSSCQRKTADPVKKHEGAITENLGVLDTVSGQTSAVKETDVDVYNTTLMEQPETAFSDAAIHKLHKENLKLLTGSTAELAKFESMAFLGCDADLKGCKSVKFLRQSSLSSQVLLKVCQLKKDISEKYRCLNLAWDLKNNQPDGDLIEAYVGDSKAYFDLLKQKGQSEAYSRHQRVMGLIIDSLQKNPRQQSIDKLIRLYEPQSATASNPGPLGDHVFKLNPFIEKTAQQLPLKSLQEVLDEVRKNQSDLFSKFNFTAIKADDPTYSTLEKVFRTDLNPDNGAALLKQYRVNPGEFSEKWLRYVRLRLSYQVSSSNRAISIYFKDFSKTTTQETLKRGFDGAQQESVRWQDFQSKVDHLTVFAQNLLAQNHEGLKDLDVITTYALGVPRNVKFMATYPHMMMMAYYLSKAKFSQPIFLGYSTRTLDASFIISRFFVGDWDPWFDYSSDMQRLSAFEILHALQFAIDLGTFRDFNVPVADFLNSAFDEIFQARLQSILDEQEKLFIRHQRNPRWSSLDSLCNAIKSNRPTANVISALEVRYSPLAGYNIEELQNNDDGGTSHPWGPFMYSNNLTNEVERIRIEFDPYIRKFQVLVDQLGTSYPDLVKTTKDEGGHPIPSLQDRINNYQKIKWEFLKRILNADAKFSDCYFKIMREDRELKAKIMETEIKVLTEIHADMTRLRAKTPADPQVVQELNNKYQFVSVNENTKKSNIRFNENVFVFYQLDFLKRMQFYTNQGYQAGNLSIAPLSNRVQVEMPENIEEQDIFQNPLRVTIPYQANVDEFVDSALKIYYGGESMTPAGSRTGFLLWWPSSGISMSILSSYWQNFIASLNRIFIQEEETARQAGWDIDRWLEIPLRGLELIGFSDMEVGYLKRAGAVRSYDPDTYTFFIRHEEVIPYYRLLFKWSFEDAIGWYGSKPSGKWGDEMMPAPPKEFVPLTRELVSFSELSQSTLNYLIPPNPDLNKRIEAVLRLKWTNQKRLVDYTLKKIQFFYERDLKANKVAKLHLVLGSPWSQVYIRDESTQNYQGYLTSFEQKTGGLYQTPSSTTERSGGNH